MVYKLGEKLRRARLTTGLTQKQVADRLGLKSDSNISAFETTNSLPDAEQLMKMAEMYHVSADYLLSLNENYDLFIVKDMTDEERFILGHMVEYFNNQKNKK